MSTFVVYISTYTSACLSRPVVAGWCSVGWPPTYLTRYPPGGDSKKIRGYFSLYSSVDIDVVDWEKKHGKRLRWLSSRSEPR
ncbi:hypothetical protein IWX46DRAFT_607326 [Phyllosticta citricarpa]|uniref:Uncharacterized protein n=1 Tax=Phyllosticta citricarpa TaxID=55181 RepID=A0ABR1LVE8_9PEZI